MNIKSVLFFMCTLCCTNVSYGTLLRADMTYKDILKKDWFKAFKDAGIITLTPTKTSDGIVDVFKLGIEISRLRLEFAALEGEDKVKKLLKIGEDLYVNNELLECFDYDHDGPVTKSFFAYFNTIGHELAKYIPNVDRYTRSWARLLDSLA